jgi:hypothetical protein
VATLVDEFDETPVLSLTIDRRDAALFVIPCRIG